jgi:thymidylate synthase
MRRADEEYQKAVRAVIEGGSPKPTRMEGVGVRSVTGLQMRFNLARDGFPLLEYKAVPLRLVCVELAWFLSGRTNIAWMQARKTRIWDDDAARAGERGLDLAEGELGPVYGHQWRNYGGAVDQIQNVLDMVKAAPASRRMVVSAWNPAEVPKMVLPPCHTLWQIVCDPETKHMDLALTMRSGDLGLGLPFNIASYAVLLQLIANECGYVARELVITVNDAHLYEDHIPPLLARFAERPPPPSAPPSPPSTPPSPPSAPPSPPSASPPPPIRVDVPGTIAEFVDAHEKNVSFKLGVSNYHPGPRLALNLHT